MRRAQPRGLNRLRVEQLLSQARHKGATGGRIDAVSQKFVGSSYKSNPLVGSAETAEVFTVSLADFDCVTYIEAVLALARSATVDEFTKWLRRIRYEHGRIQWARRNHYMTQWIRNNIRNRIVGPVPLPAVPMVVRERTLNIVPGLKAQRTRLKYVPKTAVPRLEPHLQSGDLIFFVSTRRNLDVFHLGIIVRDDQTIRIRHASRSQGMVVEQSLRDFLKANRMAGVIVVRPQAVRRRSVNKMTRVLSSHGSGVERRIGM
jgi:Protein of unknown function (DUF1460)